MYGHSSQTTVLVINSEYPYVVPSGVAYFLIEIR